MSSDWETRALEAEAKLAEQELKTKQLVELVRKQKSEWEGKIETAEAEAAKWKATAEKTNGDLILKTEQLANVSHRLDSLIALNERKSQENPDADRMRDLEGRLSLHQEAAATHRAEVELQKSEYQEELNKLSLELKLMRRELDVAKEEAKVAHERAFSAETRLGREQALSRDLSSQLNQLRYTGAATSARTATEPQQASSSTKKAEQKSSSPVRTELDDLDIDDLDIDIPDIDTPQLPDPRISTVTKATVAVAGTPKKPVPSSTPKKAQQNWDDIDSLLDDITSSGSKK